MVYLSTVSSRKWLFIAGLLAAVVFGGLSLAVGMHWSWLEAADSWVLRPFHDVGVGHPGWVSSWRAVSDVLTVLRVGALVGIVVAILRRNGRVAAFLALMLASGVVNEAVKALSNRPRPDTALTYAAGTAFPSGHALGTTVAVLAIVTLLWPFLRPAARWPAVAAGMTLVALISLARIALNVHHLSDVVAGWALGLLYYLLCVALVRPAIRPTEAPVQDSGLASPD